ncbi:MAG: NrdJb [Gammaproteobacteria bacterium]|nr:NrdJb [Gammaproteobacteria bacterium]MDH3447338.1 NrdJb [Gammaproteobacteria bacterium]
MTTRKIDQKIVKSEVLKQAASAPAAAPGTDASAEIIQMHENLARPEALQGTTYKIKTPLSEHALYVTINDITLNAGTEHELRRPFEIFINSKNMEHFQWIIALTRILSAVFRKGGDVTFLVDELRSVFDPQGGYFKKGGRYTPSIVAEIGDVIEQHMIAIGMLKKTGPDAQQQEFLDDKRREYELRNAQPIVDDGYPSSAALCRKCQVRAVVMLDNCLTCLHCGDSKCG